MLPQIWWHHGYRAGHRYNASGVGPQVGWFGEMYAEAGASMGKRIARWYGGRIV